MTVDTTPPKRALLIFNPKSGRGPSQLPRFVAALGELGWQVEATELKPGVHISTLIGQADQFQAVIAAGGDGTVSSLAYALRGKDIPLLAYPAGTANLIAQNLDLPDDPAELARVVDAGQVLRLDLGELTVAGEKRGFVLLAGTGADATMIKDAEELKERLGAVAYLLSALKQLSPRATTFDLELDGKTQQVEAMAVMVANFGRVNFRMPLARGVSPSDGELSVLVLKPGTLLTLIPNVLGSLRARLKLGHARVVDNLDIHSAKHIKVQAAEPFPLQYDGEMRQDTTPFEAQVLPGAALFLTSAVLADLET